MPNALTDVQIEFIDRFINAVPETAGKGVNGFSTSALSDWQAAKDDVDAQLRGLSDQVRLSSIPEVAEVANTIESLLSPLRVRLPAALREFDKAPQTPKARDAALAAVNDAQAWLGTEDIIDAVDGNPWGIKVTVATTLGTALDKLGREIRRIGEAQT